MFFWRGRLRAKKARSLLIELFNQRYQWALRMPIAHLLAQGDSLRFFCSLHRQIGQVVQGLYLLNRRRPPEPPLWPVDDGDLDLHPANLEERLASVMRLIDPLAAERETRRLLLEIIDLAPREKKRGQEEDEAPLLPWLSRIAEIESPIVPQFQSQSRSRSQGDSARRMGWARRAIRIVWRLPGSRLATLTDPLVVGHLGFTAAVDVSLFGLKLSDAKVRRSLVAATSDAPKDITQVSRETYAADTFWLDEGLIDARYFLIQEAQRLIARPAPQTPADYDLLVHLSRAETLVDYEFRGPDLLQGLRRATRRARPERMGRAMDRLEQALAQIEGSEDSPSILNGSASAILAFFQLLAARNDRWIVLPKRTAAWFDGLERAPADVHQRLSDVALLPCQREHVAARVEVLRALAAETAAL